MADAEASYRPGDDTREKTGVGAGEEEKVPDPEPAAQQSAVESRLVGDDTVRSQDTDGVATGTLKGWAGATTSGRAMSRDKSQMTSGARAPPVGTMGPEGEEETAKFYEAFQKHIKDDDVAAAEALLRDRNQDELLDGLLFIAIEEAAPASAERFVQLLLDHGAPVDALGSNNASPLMVACEERNPSVINALLKAKANVNARDNTRRTALHYALLKPSKDPRAAGQVDSQEVAKIFELLREHKANPNLPNKIGRTPLHHVANRGDSIVLKELLRDKTLNISPVDKRQGFTPLHDAASRGHADVAEVLIAQDALLNATSFKGNTPMHLAASRGYEKIVELLLKAGASALCYNETFDTPESFAKKKGHTEVLNLLYKFPNEAGGPKNATKVQLRVSQPSTGQREVCRGLKGMIWPSAKGSHGFDDLTVDDMLYADAPALISIEDKNEPRWIHLPANNRTWIEDVFKIISAAPARTNVPSKATPVQKILEFLDAQFLETGATDRTRRRQPHFERSLVSEDSDDYMVSSVVSVIDIDIQQPYLTPHTKSSKSNRKLKDFLEPHQDDVELDHVDTMINLKNEYEMHLPRSLDESFHEFLTPSELKRRNCDQVLSRFISRLSPDSDLKWGAHESNGSAVAESDEDTEQSDSEGDEREERDEGKERNEGEDEGEERDEGRGQQRFVPLANILNSDTTNRSRPASTTVREESDVPRRRVYFGDQPSSTSSSYLERQEPSPGPWRRRLFMRVYAILTGILVLLGRKGAQERDREASPQHSTDTPRSETSNVPPPSHSRKLWLKLLSFLQGPFRRNELGDFRRSRTAVSRYSDSYYSYTNSTTSRESLPQSHSAELELSSSSRWPFSLVGSTVHRPADTMTSRRSVQYSQRERSPNLGSSYRSRSGAPRSSSRWPFSSLRSRALRRADTTASVYSERYHVRDPSPPFWLSRMSRALGMRSSSRQPSTSSKYSDSYYSYSDYTTSDDEEVEKSSGNRFLQQIIVVPQLWLWKVDNIVVTACCDRWHKSNQRALSGSIRRNLEQSRLTGKLGVDDILRIIIQSSFDFEPRFSVGKDRRTYHDAFAAEIANTSSIVSKSYDSFKSKLGKLEQSHLKAVEDETKLLMEIDDILDEIAMIKRARQDQELVVAAMMSGQYGSSKSERDNASTLSDSQGISAPMPSSTGGRGLEAGGTARPSAQSPSFRQDIRLLRQEEDAKRIRKSIIALLDLRQRQVNTENAMESKKQSETMFKQSKILFIFTGATVIFAPLSWVAAVLDLNITDFSPSSWGQGQVWGASVGSLGGTLFLCLLFWVMSNRFFDRY